MIEFSLSKCDDENRQKKLKKEHFVPIALQIWHSPCNTHRNINIFLRLIRVFFFSSKSEIFSMRAKFNKKKATLWEKNNTRLKDCHTTISLICYKRFWQPAKQFQIEGYGNNASLTVVGNVDVTIFVISCDRKKSKAKKCNKFSHHIFSDATTSWLGLTRLSQMSPFW